MLGLLMIWTLAPPFMTDPNFASEFYISGVPTTENTSLECKQPPAEQTAIIREAEAKEYSIRRLEFLGNENIRDSVLRKRMRFLQEGEKFRRSKLVKSLASVSQLKTIHRVRLSDVVLRLEKSYKLVDITVCFREKRAAKK